MKKINALAATVLVTVGLPVTSPGAFAEDQTTIKVALTDMSSSTGMGPMGQYMMGPGYGSGQGMMGGYGMMRPGYGWGPGMMGQNMMMGMMAIRIDHDAVKAGAVKFDVTNWSRMMVHEMLIVAVDDPSTPLPYDYNAAKVPETEVKVLADTSELQPNLSREVEVTLAPGTYLLICNVAGHYAAGMATPLRVTP
jgi:uncharacterized cupredoxin-like copper-binding protein